jgi:hypothetical protein
MRIPNVMFRWPVLPENETKALGYRKISRHCVSGGEQTSYIAFQSPIRSNANAAR